MARKYNFASFESDVLRYKQQHPNSTEAEMFEHLAKYKVPGDFSGSPSWHRNALKDLQCIVQHYGMPSLFLTLTADEVSDMRFTEVKNMEDFFLRFIYSPDMPYFIAWVPDCSQPRKMHQLRLLHTHVTSPLSLQHAPVENTRMFHIRTLEFLNQHLCRKDKHGNPQPGLLGKVLHYVVHYECQNRGSVSASHALVCCFVLADLPSRSNALLFLVVRSMHTILWLDDSSKHQVQSEITAAIPGIVKDDAKHLPPNNPARYHPPSCPVEAELRQHVLRKQFHTCKPVGETGCRKHGHCSLGFPVAPHPERSATVCDSHGCLRWVYHRPDEECRNVVPYHPAVLVMWGGMQWILMSFSINYQPPPSTCCH